MPKERASGMWRSEDMAIVQLQIQRDVAHDSVLYLGRMENFDFVNLNKHVNNFQKDFATEVRRCDDMERKLRYIKEELEKSEIMHVTVIEPNEMETLNTLERKIEEKESELRNLTVQFDALMNERDSTREHLEVLNRDLGYTDSTSGGLTILPGVISKEKMIVFERLIYRATRGNSVLTRDDIDKPFYNHATNEYVEKVVFAILFSAPRLKEKLKKICEVNQANIYPYANSGDRLLAMRDALYLRYDTLSETLQQTANRRAQLLASAAAVIKHWICVVTTEKAVFNILNMLRFQGTTVIGRGWVPVSEITNVKRALREAEVVAGATAATIVEEIYTNKTPLTFFRTNKYTQGFQGIVDSYGTARYKEINPGVFTMITFPYLFGIMFGDIGHGLMLTIFAAWMVLMEKTFESSQLNEIFAMIFGGRYLILTMGLFAIYIGLLYNDMFGIQVQIFKSGYKWPPLPSQGGPSGVVYPIEPNGKPNIKPARRVAFGVDSAWSETENKLEFYNSMKMKCAVIVGVVQMFVGVILSCLNHIYHNNWVEVYFRFIPEILFLSSTFGYMCLMIIMKWCFTWESTHLAPSLLETMTNFFLSPGTVTVPLYRGQVFVQIVLLLCAVVCVPVLLFGVPIARVMEHRWALQGHFPLAKNFTEVTPAASNNVIRLNDEVDQAFGRENANFSDINAPGISTITDSGGADVVGDTSERRRREIMPVTAQIPLDDDDGPEEEFAFGDIMIHQIIHTIEYVLGCVSNTASYLRLWALSLAHAQLSEVFWNFIMMTSIGLDPGHGVFVFIGFAVWMSVTIAVLLGMESLSAFLHALRLHWVEFQNKFYQGDGKKFEPFSIQELLSPILNSAVVST